ncbi:MAG: phosphate acetyltransferase [Gemmatimonadetes bacterium]|nr:phosphate acetyltransferase [Gemmatimonadota bacterium]
MSAFHEDVRRRTAAQPRRVVFPEGDDPRTIEAVARLRQAGLLQPVVLGDPDRVRAGVAAQGADPAAITVIDHRQDERVAGFAARLAARRASKGWTEEIAREHLQNPLVFGAMLVATGEVHGSVAGAANTTGDVIRAAIWCVGLAPGITTISSAFYMVVPPFRGTAGPEVLTFTDAAVVPDPDARQLADIAFAAARARRGIVGDEPRVAFLSFSTRGSAESPSVAKVRDAVALFQAEHPEIAADGEFQADSALIKAVGMRKAPGSAIAGDANVLVFPNLDAGNIGYKLVQRLAHADAIGPILQGLALPCSDLSRGASAEDIMDTACITALQAQ